MRLIHSTPSNIYPTSSSSSTSNNNSYKSNSNNNSVSRQHRLARLKLPQPTLTIQISSHNNNSQELPILSSRKHNQVRDQMLRWDLTTQASAKLSKTPPPRSSNNKWRQSTSSRGRARSALVRLISNVTILNQH